MLLLVNVICATLLVLLTSTAESVFGLTLLDTAITVQAGIIVAVHCALRARFSEAAWVMMTVAYLSDLLASGPPGLFGFALTLVFFALFVAGSRVGGRKLIATMIMVMIGTYVLALVLGLFYGLFYPEVGLVTFSTMGKTVLFSAIATALCAVPYTIIVGWLEQLWRRRRERSILFE